MDRKIQEPSRQEIWKMFDQISPTYDRVNRAMTFGLDHYWRKKMCQLVPSKKSLKILDCATGTGDQILSLKKHLYCQTEIIGIDLAEEMLNIGREKIAKKKYSSPIELKVASVLDIPYPDATFDCITISFGIRNVTDPSVALKECFRVLKPQGRLLILEGTVPSNKTLKQFHLLYLRYFLPRIGGFISKSQEAYRYLNETIETFPSGIHFLKLMKSAAFPLVKAHPLMGGIVTIYQGDKSDAQ